MKTYTVLPMTRTGLYGAIEIWPDGRFVYFGHDIAACLHRFYYTWVDAQAVCNWLNGRESELADGNYHLLITIGNTSLPWTGQRCHMDSYSREDLEMCKRELS